MRGLMLCSLLIAGASAFAEQPSTGRWKVQFFQDKLDSTLLFVDIECPTAQHCVAVGAVSSESEKLHPTEVFTTDGGEHWTVQNLKDTPYSLFFLNDSTGWMAGEKKIWRTEDGGLKWSGLSDSDGIEQLVFRDASHGWGAGRDGSIFETVDGGKKWTSKPVGRLAWPTDQVVFPGIGFSPAGHGFLIGTAFPFGQLRTARPEWLDPKRARSYREPPEMSFAAITTDAGNTWTAGEPFSKAGTVANVHAMANGHALVVMRLPAGSLAPSAVLDVDPATSQQTLLFAEKNRVVKDALPLPGGGAILAAIEPPGTSAGLPIPGKLKMIRLDPEKTWHEMIVDYRAVASNALLASPDSASFWVATDGGMILKLEPAGTNKVAAR